MRGVRLDDLVDRLRAEVGHSTNPAVGVSARDYLVQVLRRTQDRLWEEYDWSHLKVSRDLPTASGQRYYSVPDDLPYERVIEVSFKYGDDWHELTHGIDEKHYSTYDSDRDIRSWPIMRWDVAEDTGVVDEIGVIEVWPVPSRSVSQQDGQIRLTGIRSIAPMVDGGDKCELDGTLLVLMAAAEIQARQNQADAQIKLTQATQLLSRLMNQTTNKKKVTEFNSHDHMHDGFRPREITSVTSLGGGGGGTDPGIPADPHVDLYIPLAGTASAPSSLPVTGVVEFADGGSIQLGLQQIGWGDGAYYQAHSPDNAGEFTDGAWLSLVDATFDGPEAGRFRHYGWHVSDGVTLRAIVMAADGTVIAGRPDLPTSASSSTLITKAHLEAIIPPSGQFIPLQGTAPGAPATGHVEFVAGMGVQWEDKWVMFNYPDGDILEGLLAIVPDAGFGVENGPRAFAIGVFDGTYRSSIFAKDGTVHAGRPDMPAGVPPETLITKQYFENKAGINGPFLPLSGTAPGAPITGSVTLGLGASLNLTDNGGISFGGGYATAWLESNRMLAFLVPFQLGGSHGRHGVAFSIDDGITVRTSHMRKDGTITAGRTDIPAGAPQTTVITKQYFEDKVGTDGPFLPMTGNTLQTPLIGDIWCQGSIHCLALETTFGSIASASQVHVAAATPGSADNATRKDYVDSKLMRVAEILGVNASQRNQLQALLTDVI